MILGRWWTPPNRCEARAGLPHCPPSLGGAPRGRWGRPRGWGGAPAGGTLHQSTCAPRAPWGAAPLDPPPSAQSGPCMNSRCMLKSRSPSHLLTPHHSMSCTACAAIRAPRHGLWSGGWGNPRQAVLLGLARISTPTAACNQTGLPQMPPCPGPCPQHVAGTTTKTGIGTRTSMRR